MVGRLPLALAFVTIIVPGPTEARREPSSRSATELVSQMEARKLDAFAVRETAPDRFVAAMLIPGVQLLVVSGQTTSPAYVEAQLTAQQYRDVYTALHSAVVADTKLFFQDMGTNGLSGERDDVDIMYERGAVQTIFNGDWKAQKLSKADYEAKLRTADTEYGRLLGLLVRGLRGNTVPAAPAHP